MKKLLSLLLCFTLLLTTLTACGYTKKDDDDRDRRPAHKDDEDEDDKDEEKEDDPAAVVINAYGLEVILNQPNATFDKNPPEDMSLSLPDPLFGLNELSLLPARLQRQGDTISIDSPLQYPIYSADGRVDSFSNELWRGSYSSDENQFFYHPTFHAEGVGVFGTGDYYPKLDNVRLLTDTYGCVIDLLFRSSTDCKVTLPAQGKSNGRYSYMTFTLSDTCTKEEVDAWAAAFRIVFYDQAGKFVGTASLETAKGTTNKNEYILPLSISEYSPKGDIYTDGELFDMAAGEATALSALMYLDGNYIDNVTVAASSDIDFSLELCFHYATPFY